MSFLKGYFGFDESSKMHEHIFGGADGQAPQHHSSWTNEMLAAASGFAAMKAYEDYLRRTGEQVSHPLMKEMLAGFAAAEVDKLFETKGLDFLDREKAKRLAIEQSHHLANQQYGTEGGEQFHHHYHHRSHHHQQHE